MEPSIGEQLASMKYFYLEWLQCDVFIREYSEFDRIRIIYSDRDTRGNLFIGLEPSVALSLLEKIVQQSVLGR